MNLTAAAGAILNPASFPTAMQSFQADYKTMIDANIAQQVAAFMAAMQTISSVAKPAANASAATADPTY